jgi:predicted HTH domain antitoxin
MIFGIVSKNQQKAKDKETIPEQNMQLQMQVEYPDSLPDALAETRQEFETEAKLAMAAKLFELKRISSGQAAQLLGMDRVEFLLALHRVGTPAINLTEDELLSDFRNA